jgi:hypothetical protein
MTVLFVSHDLTAIRRLCTRALWFDRGKVISDAAPDQVVNEYETFALSAMHRDAPERADGAVGRILNVRLQTPDGDEIATARTTDELEIVIEYESTRAGGTAQTALGLDADGVAVFRSLQPEPLQIRSAGVYRVAVRIPGHLLADRVYSAKASIVLEHEGQRETAVWPNALTFRLYEGGDERLEQVFNGPRPGIIQPRLAWRAVETPGRALRA